jgi:hypothetical protein
VVPDVLERGSTAGRCECRPADRVDSKRQIEVTPMDDNNQIPSEFEEQVREIVRDEQQNNGSESVQDGDGQQWSLTDLVHDVGLTRRQALLAMFYMAGGAVAAQAIMKAFSDTAEAAPSDDLTVPGTLTTSSVDTDEAIIANESVDRHQTHIETIDPSSATSAVTFSSVPSFDSYLLVFDNMILDAAGDLFIRFNGDGGGNGNYHWWDETGTKASGVDQIELVSFSSGFRRTGGTVSIDNPQNDPIGVNNDFVPAQANGIDGFAQKGGRAVNEDLSSIELRASGANIDDLSTVSLYGIVQS